MKEEIVELEVEVQLTAEDTLEVVQRLLQSRDDERQETHRWKTQTRWRSYRVPMVEGALH